MIFAIGIINILAMSMLFLWLNGKTRQGTFFSVRVEPDFANSDHGRAILKKFRRRVWLCALLTSLVFAVSFGFGRSNASLARRIYFYLVLIGDLAIFAMAARETHVKALPQPEPPARTAALFTAEEERSFTLSIIDWLGILLPAIFPAAAAILFALSWPQIPLVKRQFLLFVGVATPIAIVSSFSYFALRFRARSSDWNADSRASRKYRTVLGIATVSFPTLLSFVLCVASVFVAVPLNDATQWRLVEALLAAVFLGFPLVFFGFFGIVWWLRRNISTESADPMPDRCWKWGYFYFNSDDPALVVPLRSGINFSCNYARRPVWWFVLGPALVLPMLAVFIPHLTSSFVPPEIRARQAKPGATQPTGFSGPQGLTPPPASPFKTKVGPKDGLNYVLIPPGTFEMGCSLDDSLCDSTRHPNSQESPAHSVTITKAFWIGQTPVTQTAYTKVVGANPSYFRGDQLPVEGVSWEDAQSYCDRVDGRLPTEAEYEYAARGGSASARYAPADEIAWHSANSGDTTHEVAQKQPNGYGLYDMLGNVWEWVSDWYGPYSSASALDPKGPSQGTSRCFLKFFDCHQDRVVRGSSWIIPPDFARASTRTGARPDFRGDHTHGFRCAAN